MDWWISKHAFCFGDLSLVEVVATGVAYSVMKFFINSLPVKV